MKHVIAGIDVAVIHVSPGLTAGRGLKLDRVNVGLVRVGVSPGLTAGRGLKP
mgnify:CR=1 FL=1